MSGVRRRHRDDNIENVEKWNSTDGENRIKETDDNILGTSVDGEVDSNAKDGKTAAAAGVKDRLLSNVNTIKLSAKCFGFVFLLWILGYFGFSILWLVLGVSIYTWRKHKQEQKKIAAEILGHIADDEKKFFQAMEKLYKLSGKELPSWVYFPDVEKAEWLNKIISQLWPYVGVFVKNTLTDKIEPSIQKSNRLLESFSFTKIDLGERSPRVSGVKVYGATHTRRSEIVMDLQLVYMSDANIRVTINRLSVGIKDLVIRGLIRVELRPLINNMPLVGAVSVSFVQMPVIDFDLTELGNLFDIPGLDTIIRSAVTDTVTGMMVLPEKYVLKLAEDIDISRLMFPLPKGVLRVHVLEARNLEEKDRKILGIGGGSDPFVVVKVGRETEFKTQVIEHNLNPVWNESFECPVMEFHTSMVEVTLYDYDGAITKADFLGCASISMASIYEGGVIDEWLPLSNVSKGDVHIKMEWLELSDDIDKTMEAMEHVRQSDLNSALLNIYVDSAKDLPLSTVSKTANQISDPVQSLLDDRYEPSTAVKIKLKLAHQEKPFKTKVIENSNSPVWEENFQALIFNPVKDSISFTVNDSANDDEILGKLKIRMSDILSAPNMIKEEPFALSDSGPNAKLQLRATLRLLIPKRPIIGDGSPKKSPFSIVTPKRDSAGNTSRLPKHFNEEVKREGKAEASEETEEISQPTVDTPPPVEKEKPNATDDEIASTDDSELNFVDKTLAFFVANSPRNRNASRSESTASELSLFDESKDPRRRAGANGNNNADESFFGRLCLKLSYSEKREQLLIEVLRAENLIVCDEDNHTSDPYVRIYLQRHGKHSLKRKTRVVKNTLYPKFDETFDYEMMRSEIRHYQLDIAVKNKTGLLSTEKALMGQVMIDLKNYDFSDSQPKWYPLKIFPKDHD